MPLSRNRGLDKKLSFQTTYRHLRNFIKREINHAKVLYYRDRLTTMTRNPKEFWKTISQITRRQSSRQSASPTVQDLSKKFSETVQVNQACPPFENWLSVESTHMFKFKPIKDADVEKTLDRLDANKSCGSDMEAKFLKIGAHVSAPSLTAIFNASLKTSIFPDDWKTAVVTPVFKKGDRSEASNYRPISLLPCVSKGLEELVFKQLSLHLESPNLLPDCQYGFRKQRSTEDATMLLADNILTAKDSGLCSGAVFLDLSKAFDTVASLPNAKEIGSCGC